MYIYINIYIYIYMKSSTSNLLLPLHRSLALHHGAALHHHIPLHHSELHGLCSLAAAAGTRRQPRLWLLQLNLNDTEARRTRDRQRHMCTYVCMNVCGYMCVCLYVYIRVCDCVCLCVPGVCACVRARNCVYLPHIRALTHTHAHRHTP